MDKQKTLWRLVLSVSSQDTQVSRDHVLDSKEHIMRDLEKVVESKDVNSFLEILRRYDLADLNLPYNELNGITLRDYARGLATIALNK